MLNKVKKNEMLETLKFVLLQGYTAKQRKELKRNIFGVSYAWENDLYDLIDSDEIVGAYSYKERIELKKFIEQSLSLSDFEELL